MSFSLIMQPFLCERFYHYIQQYRPKQAYDAILTGFQLYAYQRGLRAAQRSIRDGAPLNFENYRKYHEVVPTAEMQKIDKRSRNEKTLNREEFVGRTYECVIHDFFLEADAPKEIEELYCRHIDCVNVHGFCPDIHYESISTLRESGCCVQRSLRPQYESNIEFGLKMPDAPPYAYLVANEYASISKILTFAFGAIGDAVSGLVKMDFIEHFGQEDWEEIEKYLDADFNSPFAWE